MTSVMVFMSAWFDTVRWVGALYLIYLGARQLMGARERVGAARMSGPSRGSGSNWYLQGLIVSLSNPKVILFLSLLTPGQSRRDNSPCSPCCLSWCLGQ